jgi:GxxExxY protein
MDNDFERESDWGGPGGCQYAGGGVSGKVYERALVQELRVQGMRAEAQVAVDVSYKGEKVGSYFVDIVVEDELVIEAEAPIKGARQA